MYYRITEAGKKILCSSSTLRKYDRLGYLVPELKLENGERRYSEDQLNQFMEKYTTEEYKSRNIAADEVDFWMTKEEVSAYLGCSRSKVDSLRRKGLLMPGYIPPGEGRVYYSSVMVYEYLLSISTSEVQCL